MHGIIASILQNTIMITSFVMVMMQLIEYVNVVSKGTLIRNFQSSRFKQVLIAAMLGLIPGCLGGFAAVSLFTHNIISFGALIACLIATFGDEAFVMFAVVPETAALLSAIIFLIAILAGFAVNIFVKKFPTPFGTEHFEVHPSDEHDHTNITGNWKQNLRHVSFERALLMAGIVLLIVAILMGWFEHVHEMDSLNKHVHIQEHARGYDYGNASGILLKERWLNILFVAVSCVALFLITTVQDHFLKEHLWGHIIRIHLPRIFFWTLGVLTVLQAGEYFFDFDGWVRENRIYALAMAILIGLIPESGPHIVFITLFASGSIPFSVLLANSIVQEGHAGLPLLAESKKGFLWMKAISVIIGLIVGLSGYFMKF